MRATVKGGALLCALLSPAAMAAWEGVVDWAQRTELSTATSGVVESVGVRPGEHVGKGESLLVLDQRALHAEVSRTRSAVAYATLLYEEANRELERTEELYARTLLADRDLNLARIAHAEADAVLQRRRAEHALAQQRLDNSQLKAPFDAMVLAIMVRPGQTVVTRLQAEPQVVLVAADRKLVRFEVNGNELRELTPGSKVNVEVDGKRYEGEVEALLYDTSAAGKSVTIEAGFATETRLLPGSSVKVSLPLMACRRCHVSGRVQGVWYRAATREQAQKLGVTGHARNLPDGRVEVLACGEDAAVAELCEWLWEGSAAASVTAVECTSVNALSPGEGFIAG